MNQATLIDAIVRQTMILIAQLATASGVRTPLSKVANQVFLHLVEELQAAGVGQKVIADMFGMALRTYHERVRRLSESVTDRGQTLWEAVFREIQEKGTVSRGDILRRFCRDDPLIVRSILKDLVDSGMVYRSGKGHGTAFRARRDSEMATADGGEEGLRNLIWALIHRMSPVKLEDVEAAINLDSDVLDRLLSQLEEEGRIRRQSAEDGVQLVSDLFMIPFGSALGWEAALFDHYHTVVSTMVAKLQHVPAASKRDLTGGSTYTFDLWEGHPMTGEVLGLLGRLREEVSEIRDRLDRYNEKHGPVKQERSRVSFYMGQMVPVGSPLEEKEEPT